MKFIEMSGQTLMTILSPAEKTSLKAAGIKEHHLVRINPQGDLEVREEDDWGIIGGLIGDFEDRIKQATGLDWA